MLKKKDAASKNELEKKPRHKQPERYEGSRFAPVILLILTILASLIFSSFGK